MDVKDISRAKVAPPKIPQEGQPTLQRAASVLTSSENRISNTDSSAVRINQASKPVARKDSLGAVNRVISAINVASEATTEIGKLLKSVDGIVKQAIDQDPSPQRVEALEREAKDLVGAIKRTASDAVSEGVRPLLGEEIEVEIKSLNQALDLILPDGAAQGFGLNEINLTKKETIVQTRVAVAIAREQLEGIREAVDRTKSAVTKAVNELDIAAQNSEAAQSSLRDLDQAIALGKEASLSIKSDPGAALGSFTGPQARSLELLK